MKRLLLILFVVAVAVTLHPPAAHANQTGSNPAPEDRWEKRGVYVNAVVNGALVLVTLVLALYAVKQANAAKVSADAAKVSADALIASERAWVMVDIERASSLFIADQTSQVKDVVTHSTTANVKFICSNQGKTPAKIVEQRIRVFVTNMSKQLPQKPDLDIPDVNSEPFYLRSGQESTKALDADDNIPFKSL